MRRIADLQVVQELERAASRRDKFKTKLHTWERVGGPGSRHQVEGLRENEENPDQASEGFWNRSWGGFADRDGLGDLDP